MAPLAWYKPIMTSPPSLFARSLGMKDLRRGTDRYHFPSLENHGAGCEPGGLSAIVCHYNAGHVPFANDALEERLDSARRDFIEGGGRLVQKNRPRLICKRARDRDALRSSPAEGSPRVAPVQKRYLQPPCQEKGKPPA